MPAILVPSAAIGLAAALAVAALAYWVQDRRIHARSADHAQAVLASAAALVDAHRTGGRALKVLDALRDAWPEIVAITVVDPTNVALWPPGGIDRLPVEAHSVAKLIPGVGTVTVFYRPPSAIGTVAVVGVVAAAAALVVLLLVVAARQVERRVSHPLRALRAELRDALDGDCLRRASVPEGGSTREVRSLIDEFNALMARITDLSVDAIDQGRELNETRAALRLSAQLEEQRLITENTNSLLAARVAELSLLYEINKAVSSTLDLRELLAEIVVSVGERMNLREFSVMLLNEEHRELVLQAAYGFEVPEPGSVVFSLDEGIAGEVARTGKMMLVSDVACDSRYVPKAAGAPATGSLLSLPLKARGETIGVINFSRTLPATFEPTDILHLNAIADQCALALHNATLYEKAVQLSLHDALTGMGNRRLMSIRLDSELRRSARFGEPVSVLMIDVDHFKELNDLQGHAAGDEVLRRIAAVLIRSCREVDTVVRYGGEEFVVILPRTGTADALTVAEKIRVAVQAEGIRRRPVLGIDAVTVSVGISTRAGGESDFDPGALVMAADAAMYRAKQMGRNRTVATGAAELTVRPRP